MSTTIDEKVVEMKFDNRDFENNVKDSMSTLDKLKASLNFGDAAKSFGEVSKAADGVDVSALGGAIESIKGKFSAMEVVAVTALMNITNKAMNAGENLVKSLSVDQITAGWGKFEEKTRSVQTIMAATNKDIEYVTSQLDKLNWYTDETSYNFVDMTSNIGKFTANDVALDKSAVAMMGISNAAALAGQGVASAGRVMYNFSQALGMGAVKLQDWMSVENANMATKQFKETIIETAKEIGTLDENGKILTGSGGHKSGIDSVNFQNFRNTLVDGWVTTEVLVATLEKYGNFSNELYTLTEKTGLTATEALRYLDKYSEGLLDIDALSKATGMSTDYLSAAFESLASDTNKLGREAFKAAQEAKTFSDVIDATKDAVSTGWMNTFEILFGDYEEAKVFWTDLANALYDVFAAGGEVRNEILGGAMNSDWSRLKKSISTTNTTMEEFEDGLIEAAKNSGVAVDDIIKESGSFKESLKEGWVTTEIAVSWLDTYISSLEDLGEEELKEAGHTQEDIDALKEYRDQLKAGEGDISDYINGLTELGGRDNLMEAFWNMWDSIGSVVGAIKTAFGEVFPLFNQSDEAIESLTERVYNATVRFRDFTAKLKPSEELLGKITNAFKGLFSVVKLVVDIIGSAFKIVSPVLKLLPKLLKLILNIGSGIGNLTSSLSGKLSSTIDKIVTSLTEFLSAKWKSAGLMKILLQVYSYIDKIKKKAAELKQSITDAFSKPVPVIKILQGYFKGLWEMMKGFASIAVNFGSGIIDKIANWDFSRLANVVQVIMTSGIFVSIRKLLKDMKGGLGIVDDIKDAAEGITDKIKEVFGSLKDILVSYQKSIQAKTLFKIAEAVGILAASLYVISLIEKDKLLGAIAAIGGLFEMLVRVSKKLGLIQAVAGRELYSGLLRMAGAVYILALALNKIASLSLTQIGKGVFGVAVLAAILVGFVKAINKVLKSTKDMKKMGKPFQKMAGGLVIFALAIRILAGAVEKLGKLSLGELIKGLVGVVVLVAALGKFTKNVSGAKKLGSIGFGLVLLAVSLKIISGVVKDFAGLSWKQLIKGLGGVVAVLIALGFFIALTKDVKTDKISKKNSKNFISIGAGLLLMSVGLLLIAKAIKSLAGLNLSEMTISAGGLIAVIGALAGFSYVMGKSFDSAGSIVAVGFSLDEMAAAVWIIAKALSSLSGINLSEMAIAVGGLGLVLAELAGMMAIMKLIFSSKDDGGGTSAIAYAGALDMMSVAVIALAAGLKILGSMSLAEIGKALLGLFGAFVVLGTAAALLSPLAPVIFILSDAIALIGVGIAAFGAGLVLIGAGITSISVSIAALGGSGVAIAGELVAILGTILLGIIELIPAVAIAIADGFVEFAKAIGEGAPVIADAVGKIVLSLIPVLTMYLPMLVESIMIFIDLLLSSLARHMPRFIEAGFKIIMALLEGIKSHAADIVTTIIDTLLSVGQAIIDKIPEIVTMGIDIIVALIDGLTQGVTEGYPKIKEAIQNLGQAIVDVFCDLLGINSPSTVFSGFGGNIIEGLKNGISSGIENVLTVMSNLVTNLVTGIKSRMGDFAANGRDFISNIKSGISEKAEELKEKAKSIISSVSSAISGKSPEFLAKGQELFDKVKSGISGKLEELKTAANNVINSVKTSISGKKSEFNTVGSNLMSGLKNGISSAAQKVISAATSVVTSAIDAVKKKAQTHSPSKVTTEIGQYFGEGFAIGIESTTGEVSKASESMASGAIDAVHNGMDGIRDAIALAADLIENGVSDDLTIKPVLDLSEVQNGTMAIGQMLGGVDSGISVGTVGIANRTSSDISRSRSLLSDENQTERKLDELIAAVMNLGENDDPAQTNNTFNIYGNNPKEIADEISRLMQKKVERRRATWE